MSNIEKHHFVIRTYGFGELAQKYMPHLTAASASISFRKWLELNLQTKNLIEPRRKYITPKETSIIIDALGVPECDFFL